MDGRMDRPGWLGLRPGWLGLRPGWLDLRPGWLGLMAGWLGLKPGWMAQRGEIRMDGQKIYPFYSSSPIGAAALLSPLKPKAWLAGWPSGLASWASGLAGWASGLTGWPREGDVWMHV